jgi:hypothetical protein
MAAQLLPARTSCYWRLHSHSRYPCISNRVRWKLSTYHRTMPPPPGNYAASNIVNIPIQ